MIICHSRKFIFFSNPKTGSESLRQMFAPWSEEPVRPWRHTTADDPFYPHMPPAEAAAALAARGLDISGYRTITCIRNPYDRLVSLYRMIRDVDGLWRMRRSLGLGTPSFPVWLRGTQPSGRGGGGRGHQRWRRYGTWSAQAWCAGRVDHVLRLEHLEADLQPVLGDLGLCPGQLPHVNRRGRIDLSVWYDDALSRLVAERYAWDLAQFGYAPPVLRQAA